MMKTVAPSVDVIVNGVPYKTEMVNGVHRFRKNEAVSFIVDKGGYVLNDLAYAVLNEKIRLEDWIAFETMHGRSIGGFLDSITSLIDMNPEIFTGPQEQYFTIENPLWED